MKDNKFEYCPQCGSKDIQTINGGRKWMCPNCSLDLYNNVASAVGLIITDSQGQLLMEKRAKEPSKGLLAFPGGFTDPDESIEEAAYRECKEELGIEPLNLKYLCSCPNDYEYRGIHYKTCDIYFTAQLPDNAKICRQEKEVEEIQWVKIQTKEDVEKYPVAFESAKKALLKWQEKGRNK